MPEDETPSTAWTPAEAFEDGIELALPQLASFAPGEAGFLASSYPFPSLEWGGAYETRTLPTVVLENVYLRVAFAPDLGGRPVSFFDKRTETELLPSPSEPRAGGPRGIHWPMGGRFVLVGAHHPTELAPVEHRLDLPSEDGTAGVWFSEAATPTGLSYHLHWTLPADRAELTLEVTVYNRTNQAADYAPAFIWFGSDTSKARGNWIYDSGRKGGIAAFAGSLPLERLSGQTGNLVSARFASPAFLAPYQRDVWSVRFCPISGLAGVTRCVRAAAIFESDDLTEILVTEVATISDESGSLELDPMKPIRIEGLVELPLPTDPEWQTVPCEEMVAPVPISLPADLDDIRLTQATFDVSRRHLAYREIGRRALAAADFPRAQAAFERSLLFNAEDPLAWWGWALAERRDAEAGESESSILPNGHFLAPMEPVFRAEAFLAQSTGGFGKEGSPLVAPMKDRPDELVEVACMLLDMGQDDEAIRWLDEAIRHVDLPVLRFLLAQAFARRTSMEIEIGMHLAAAEATGFVPPYPYRATEWAAIGSLAKRYPGSNILAKYWDLRKFFVT